MAADVTGDESDKSADESEAGVAADVTGDESESGGMSPAQEVEEEAVETWSTHVRKHGQTKQHQISMAGVCASLPERWQPWHAG